MKANKNIIIVDDQVVLVPYREEHVARYHEWMADPAVQELTASEPLTIEEEYEMQKKWQEDEDKLTFIICARTNDLPIDSVTSPSLTMIGDVNLFLKGSWPPSSSSSPSSSSLPSTDLAPDSEAEPESEFEAEVEIMIAEPAYRRKGLALIALQLMLSYATSPSPSPSPPSASVSGEDKPYSPLRIPRERLVVRIGDTNEPSMRLFKKLGFVVTKHVEVFGEVEMRYTGGVFPSTTTTATTVTTTPTTEDPDAVLLDWRAGEIRRVP